LRLRQRCCIFFLVLRFERRFRVLFYTYSLNDTRHRALVVRLVESQFGLGFRFQF
jgi:hypothetical protein